MLESSEKAPFNELAKQYKDAFFSENPNFKWHKLPAPPLRSLPPRPKLIERDSSMEYEEIDESTANNDLQELKLHHFDLKRVPHTVSVSEVANFKFADETQMGGLSQLIDSSQAQNRTAENDDIERPLLNGFKRKFNSTVGEGSFSSSEDDNIDFELYDRIKALPALDYDEYLQRKKTSKKVKKINLKKKSADKQSQVASQKQPSAEDFKNAALAAKTKMQIVGSQKRKARKESITRRNVDEFQNIIVNIQTMPDGTFPTAQIAPSSTTSDLDILAEVATHRELLGNYS
uniref:Uncharacterized protein n=1 Tax=Megaselia scalaris TaxID=36166 RepID=T1H2P3_MEGSC